MSRTVDEWVGAHDDQAIPPRVKVRIFERCEGRCYLSGVKVMPGGFDFDHIIALANGGAHKESNLAVIAKDRHREKTASDVALKSKIARTKLKHLGLWKPKGRKLQSRGFQ